MPNYAACSLTITNSWYKKKLGLINYLLLPFSWLFYLVSRLRYYAYKIGILKQTHFPIPIIVVGNITVGGTGKTPLVIWLAKLLQQNNLTVGIVSRGYSKHKHPTPHLVAFNDSSDLVGDEALVILNQVNCPLVIADDRVAAVKYLLNIDVQTPPYKTATVQTPYRASLSDKTTVEMPYRAPVHNHKCDVIISDDGLQHYRLARDIEIAVIDGERLFGNEKFLPAGPLREPISRLKTVDFIVGTGLKPVQIIRTGFKPVPTVYPMHFIPHHLSHVMLLSEKNIVNSDEAVQTPYRASLLIQLDIKMLNNKTIHAVAGIGNPQRFFATLKSLGANLIEHPFPDHYVFTKNDICFADDYLVVMTEKDAVKCTTFADERHYYLSIEAELDTTFGKAILEKITNYK